MSIIRADNRRSSLGALVLIAIVTLCLGLEGATQAEKPVASMRGSRTVVARRHPRTPLSQSHARHRRLPKRTAKPRVLNLTLNDPLQRNWPIGIETAVLSPDGKTVAFYDTHGVYLSDRRGRHAHKLRMKLHENLANETLNTSFFFRPDGKRVAILTTLDYGEPLGAFIERLWTADTTTGRVRKLHEWMDRVQGPGPITAERKLGGWSSNGRSVLIVGTVYNGAEMPIDAREVGKERVSIKDVPVPKRRIGKR
jgi:hypothetical protein